MIDEGRKKTTRLSALFVFNQCVFHPDFGHSDFDLEP